MRLPTGCSPRLTGWIASCGRHACSSVIPTSHRHRLPTPFAADTNCLKSNTVTATMTVDLALAIWPRERPMHTIHRALYCAKCQKGHGKKRRPDLIGLRIRKEPDPTSPAAAMR
jgi:hypothetical protein